MQKRSVNLLIIRETESPRIKKLKIFLPVAATVSLFLFVIFFFSSIIYVNQNNEEFNSLKLQIDILEKKISAKKNIEGVHNFTVARIKSIGQLSANTKKFTPLLSEILKLQKNGLAIAETNIDKKNKVNFSVTASSSGTLDDFISDLEKAEGKKLFSNIKSSGIVRDKTGAYLLTITLDPNPTLLGGGQL